MAKQGPIRQVGRRFLEGRVIKANTLKTRVIAVEQRVPHELYKRIVRRTVKFVTHDEKNESQVGDLVRIQECRPMSRTKRWRLVKILERNAEQ